MPYSAGNFNFRAIPYFVFHQFNIAEITADGANPIYVLAKLPPALRSMGAMAVLISMFLRYSVRLHFSISLLPFGQFLFTMYSISVFETVFKNQSDRLKVIEVMRFVEI